MSELLYARGGDRFTRELPSLDAEGQRRVHNLLAGPVASLHEHPVRLPHPLDADSWRAHMARAEDVLAVEELAQSTLDVVVATCFSQPDPDFVFRWAHSMRAQIGAAEGLRPWDGIVESGTTAVGLGLEDLGTIETLTDLDELRAAGIMMAGIAYNTGSRLGCGLAQHDTGLTDFGRQAVAHMNELGMIIDVSHAGDRTSLDAVDASQAPVVINHAGAQGLWGSTRMVPDVVIRAVAASGGVIGIEAAPGSTRTRPGHAAHTVIDVVTHIEYCAELVGTQAVALGGDTFYGDHVGLYRALKSTGAVPPEGAVSFDMNAVSGADNPTELPIHVAYELVRRGWGDEDIARVLGGNALRILAGAR